MPPLRIHPPKSFNRAVGLQVRRVRTDRGMSQKELARSNALRPEAVSKYESGVHPPTLRSLHGMAQTLCVPAECLLPEIAFAEEADRQIYAFFRNVWFTPLQTRRLVATLLSCCAKFQEIAPLYWCPPAGGLHVSPKR